MKSTSWTERKYAFNTAPRCGARTKNNNGQPCRCPAIKGKSRCRVHGGAKGSGAPRGNINAVTHGQTTTEIKAFRRKVRLTFQINKLLQSG